MKRYVCKLCRHSFSINHRKKLPPLWIPHVDGLAFRKLANQHNKSQMAVFKIARNEMENLPPLKDLSKEFSTDWSGILLVDGKFIKVREQKSKIPWIYGVDYLSHDIPAGLLALSESTSSFDSFFSQIREIEYPLRLVVGDDSGSLKKALNERFPGIPFQLCQTHYLENVRQTLKTRRDEKYLPFFMELKLIFDRKVSREERLKILKKLKAENKEALLQGIILDLWRHYGQLFAYEEIGGDAPHSNNLIECYNSHVNGRLKTVKGFESFSSAERWMNAWMTRRRIKPLTDCRGKFKKLNGRCPIEHSLKSGAELEDVFRFLSM